MGRIILDDDYFIKVDETGYMLCYNWHRKDHSGREHIKPLGQYTRLDTAVKAWEEILTRHALDSGSMSLTEALERVSEVMKEVYSLKWV